MLEKDSVTFSTAARLALLDYDRSRRITNIVYAKKWKVLLQDRGNVVSAAGRCFLSRFKNAEPGGSINGRNLILQLSLCIFVLSYNCFLTSNNIEKHYRNQLFAAEFLILHVRVSELRKAAFSTGSTLLILPRIKCRKKKNVDVGLIKRMRFENLTRGIPRALPSANAPPRAQAELQKTLNPRRRAEEMERKRAKGDGLGDRKRGTMREPLVTASGETRA